LPPLPAIREVEFTRCFCDCKAKDVKTKCTSRARASKSVCALAIVFVRLACHSKLVAVPAIFNPAQTGHWPVDYLNRWTLGYSRLDRVVLIVRHLPKTSRSSKNNYMHRACAGHFHSQDYVQLLHIPRRAVSRTE
jgi:hypothetical protein